MRFWMSESGKKDEESVEAEYQNPKVCSYCGQLQNASQVSISSVCYF